MVILSIILSLIELSATYGNTPDVDKFNEAMTAYKTGEFLKAYNLFTQIKVGEINDKVILSSSEFYAADCLFQMKELNGAAPRFESFLYNYPNSSFKQEALYKLGTIYYTLNEFRKSRERLMTLINDYPNSEYYYEANYWIGEDFTAEKNFFDAEVFLKNAIAVKNNNNLLRHSLFALAFLYEKLSRYEDAVKYYDDLLAYFRESDLAPISQLRIGICYFYLKKYDNAVLELSDPLIKKLNITQQLEAKYFLANSFVRLKEYNEAKKNYDSLLKDVVKLSIDTAEFAYLSEKQIKYELAWVNFQARNYNAAFELFNELSNTSQDSLAANALFWSAECKRYSGEVSEALKIYDSFLKKFPNNPLTDKIKYSIAAIYYNQNDIKMTEELLHKSSEIKDKQTLLKTFVLLGESNLNEGNFEEAEKYFSDVYQSADVSAELTMRAEFGLAVSKYFLNDYKGAVTILESLKKRAPDFESDKVNFYLAETYFMLNNFSKALKFYMSVNTLDPQIEKQVIYGKAFTYFNMKDYANAIYYFNSYITKYPTAENVKNAKLKLADSYYGIKNFEKASEIYQQLFSRDRHSLDNDFAYYQFAQSLYKANKTSNAISEFINLQKRFPRSKYADASQYVVGWIYFQQNEYRKAIDNYLLLIDKYPNSNLIPIALYSIGDSYFNLELYDTAITYYNKVLQNYSNTTYVFDAVNGIQYSYIAKNQPEKAIEFIDNFLQDYPNSTFRDQILFKKGDIYYSIENFKKAIESYNQFIQSYPESKLVPNAYYWIGKSQENVKLYDDALSSFKYVINNYLKSEVGVSAVIESVNIYLDKKSYPEAIELLAETEAKIPNSERLPEILYLKGIAEEKNSNIADAYNTFNQVITYYDGTIFAAKSKLELGILELQNGNFENAALLFKDVSEKRNDDIGAEAQYYYGVSLFKQDKITDAITAFVRVRSVFSAYDEWFTKSLLMLGDCYVKLKDIKQAREMYKAVLIRHNTGELAQQARAKLRRL
ncbi:tetratricopeptide repeat protein [Melioribacteraceae bacterium 4301-Me]|uniref:tetratricopeptide repeat protein n=1 Tax=Pyranulibacter aquaticus TaxID=3163344 RepID=UPI003595FF7B